MSTICLRSLNSFILLLEKTEPAQHNRGLYHVDPTHFLQTSPNTLPLYNNLSHNFPKAHHLSHLHFQPSHESRIHQFLPEFSAPPRHTLLEG